MSTENDAIETPSAEPLLSSESDSHLSASEPVELNQLARRVRPGAVVHLKLEDGSSRRLTVEASGLPEWTDHELAEGREAGVVLSGYGTTYMIITALTTEAQHHPILSWPSKAPLSESIISLTVEDPADEQIRTEKTASDMYWRISRHDGQ